MRLVVAANTAALNDWEFDDQGDVISPGGRDVAIWIAEALSTLGVVTIICMHDYYGWTFDLEGAEGRTWCLIAMGAEEDSMYFWAEVIPPLWKRLLGKSRRPSLQALGAVEELLRSDERFRNVRIEAPGT